MKKVTLMVIAISCLIGLLAAGCSEFGYIAGAGPIVNTTFNYTDFTGVDISSAFEFDISQSNNYSIVTSSNESIVEHLDINKTGNTLIVRLKNGSFTNSNPRVTITMPTLEKLNISGASKGSAHDFKSASDFNLTVSGASQLNLGMETGITRVDTLRSQQNHRSIEGSGHPVYRSPEPAAAN